jgi:hypothetical protein
MATAAVLSAVVATAAGLVGRRALRTLPARAVGEHSSL